MGKIGFNGSANWTIFAGNQIRNGVKQSKLDLEASVYDLETSQNNVLFDVIGFFMNVVFNQELLETAKLQLASTEQQVERTERLVEADYKPHTVCCRQEYQCSELRCNCDIRCWSGTFALRTCCLKASPVGVKCTCEACLTDVEARNYRIWSSKEQFL